MYEEVPISSELKRRFEEHCMASAQNPESVLHEVVSGFVSEKMTERKINSDKNLFKTRC